jgi:hypothetical protein
MEPRRKESKAPKPRLAVKQKRFHILKLEERITPKGGHHPYSISSTDCFTSGTASIE